LNLKYDELLSNVAFNSNLRRFNEGITTNAAHEILTVKGAAFDPEAGAHTRPLFGSTEALFVG